MRGSEHESFTPPSRPLFKDQLQHACKERLVTTVTEPLEKVGPRSRWPWVGRPVGSAGPQGGPPGAPLWPGDSATVMNFGNMVHGQKFAQKDVQIIFPKDFETQKNVFGIFV